MRFTRSTTLILACAGLFSSATATTPIHARTQPDRDQRFVLPRPTGPFVVGVTSFHLTDRSRPETATLDPNDVRELIVHVRYPAQHTGHTRRDGPYFPNEQEGRLNAEAVGLPSTFFDPVTSWSHVDVPIARTRARWPVILFSPGLGTPLPFYTTVMEDLASHGFVVIGIQHPYSTGVTILRGGRVAAAADNPGYDADIDALHTIWVDDTRFVLDTLVGLHRRFEIAGVGRLDLDRLAAVGHSFGGAASATLAMTDRRIDAAVNLDGRFFGPVIEQGLDQPFLLMDSDTGIQDPTRPPFLQHLGGPGYDLQVAGAGHNNFSDQGVLFPLLQRAVPEVTPDLLGLGPIDADRAIDITRTYLRAFLDRHLRGRRTPLLNGNSPAFPEVILTLYNPEQT